MLDDVTFSTPSVHHCSQSVYAGSKVSVLSNTAQTFSELNALAYEKYHNFLIGKHTKPLLVYIKLSGPFTSLTFVTVLPFGDVPPGS